MDSFSKHLKEPRSDCCVREDSCFEITAREEVASSKDAIEEKEITVTKTDVTCPPKNTIPNKFVINISDNIVAKDNHDQAEPQHSKVSSIISREPTVILTNESNEDKQLDIICDHQLDSRKALMQHRSSHKELFRRPKRPRLHSNKEESTSNESVAMDEMNIRNNKDQGSAKHKEAFPSQYPSRSESLESSCNKTQPKPVTSMNTNTQQLNVAGQKGETSGESVQKCESEKDQEMNVSFGTLIKAFLSHDYHRTPPIKAFAIMGIDTRPIHQQGLMKVADTPSEDATHSEKSSPCEGSSHQCGSEKDHDLVPNSSESIIGKRTECEPNKIGNSTEVELAKKNGKVIFAAKPKFDDERQFCITCNCQLDSKESFRLHKNRHKRQIRMWKLRKGWEIKRASISILFSQNPQFDEQNNFCTTCNRGFPSRISFKTHKNSHWAEIRKKRVRSEVTFSCELCSEQFKSKFSLREHVVMQHGDRIPKSLEGDPTYLKCRFCHNQFEKPTERYLHEKSHANEQTPYRCSLCAQCFPRSSGRRNHELFHRENGPVFCSYCPKAFRIQAHLDRHTKLFHSLTKPFSCEYCNKSFRRNSYLVHHKFSHSRPHKCDECGKRLAQLRSLHRHKKRHANQRNHKCETCDKLFSSTSDLQRHMTVHLDVWFQCPNCERRYKEKSDMTAHMETHKGEDTNDGTICDDKFTQGSGLHPQLQSHSDKL